MRLWLNGWQRIGLIASVLWPVIGFFTALHVQNSDRDQQLAYRLHNLCSPLSGADAQDLCGANQNKYLDLAHKYDRENALLIALVPIPLGWVIGYLIAGLTGWVAAGFRPRPDGERAKP